MIVISIGIMISAEGPKRKKANEIDLIMSDRTVPRRHSTDHSENRIEKEEFEIQLECSQAHSNRQTIDGKSLSSRMSQSCHPVESALKACANEPVLKMFCSGLLFGVSCSGYLHRI